MTSCIPENVSTCLVDWRLVTLMDNTMPPRDPNDDDDEDEEGRGRGRARRTGGYQRAGRVTCTRLNFSPRVNIAPRRSSRARPSATRTEALASSSPAAGNVIV